MKGFVVGLIVLGGVCLVGGAAILAFGMSKGKINDNLATNEHKITDSFDDIEIDVETADVDIKKAEDGQAKVVCVEKEKVYHTAEVSNNKLVIKVKDERRWYQKYLFNWNFKSMSVTVYLPEETYSDLAIESNTGHIVVDKEFTFANINLSDDTGTVKLNNKATGDVEIKVHTGSVNLNNFDAASLKVKTSTGDVNYKSGEVAGNIELQSSTGDHELEGVKAKSLNVKSSTGHVHLTDVVIDNNMDIKTSTGDVRFERSDAKEIKVETSTGSIKGTLLTSKLFSGQSDTGSVKFPKMDEWDQEGGKFEAKSDTGSIDIKIA